MYPVSDLLLICSVCSCRKVESALVIASFPGFPLLDFSTAGEIKARGKPGNEATLMATLYSVLL